jgi:hypothetical protein
MVHREDRSNLVTISSVFVIFGEGRWTFWLSLAKNETPPNDSGGVEALSRKRNT